jgi:signal transduction histidine kinase
MATQSAPSDGGASRRRERRFRLSIPTKIFLGFALVLVLFSSVLVYNFATLGRLYEEVTVINRGLVPLRLTLSELEGDLRSYSLLLATRDPIAMRSAVLASRVLFPVSRRVDLHLNRCRESIRSLEARTLAIGERGAFERLREVLQTLEGHAASLAEQSVALERALEAEDFDEMTEVREAMLDRLALMQAETASLARQTDLVVVSALEWASERQRRSVLTTAIGTALALIVALLAMVWSARTLRPLTRLTEGVKTLRGGAYETVEVRAKNEIGDLAGEFNEMVRALEERDRRLERAHRVAIEAERLAAIGRLTSQITHEIRNPLSSMALNIELLEEEVQGEPDPKEAVVLTRAITDEIDRLTSITEDYLRFARLPAPQLSEGDLNEMVKGLLAFHGQELQQAGIEVEADLQEGLPPAAIDEGQLRQALLNLVRNAREAMPHGGRLQLRTRVRGDEIEVLVRDWGGGVNSDALPHIFDPFFTTKSQGTGLGLPLTRQIIRQHGGEIVCRNHPSGGTEFRITLPVSR